MEKAEQQLLSKKRDQTKPSLPLYSTPRSWESQNAKNKKQVSEILISHLLQLTIYY